MRRDVKPSQFLVIRDSEYVPMGTADLRPGEDIFYYRGPGYEIEKCTIFVPYLGRF